MLALLPPALLLLANTEVSAGLRLELQAGEAPTMADINPTFFVAALLRPEVTLKVRSPTTETRIAEAPRLLLRRPNIANRSGPLYLNSLQVEHRGHRGARLNWNLQLTSMAGEVDYMGLGQVLPRQAALPQTLDLLTAEGSGWLGWRTSRRLELGTEVGVVRRQPLGASASAASSSFGLTLPTETDERVEPRLTYALSRRQVGQLRLKLTNYRLTGSLRLWAMAAELRAGWSYKLTRYRELQLTAGVAVATAFERSDPEQPWTPLAPLGEVALVTAQPLSRIAMLRGRAAAEVAWYLDPVLGASLPRAQVSAGLGLEVGPAWLLAFNLMAATNISRHPMVGYPIETFIVADAPLRHRVGRHWVVDLGGRFSERGPHLATSSFTLSQRELIGYVALTAVTQ